MSDVIGDVLTIVNDYAGPDVWHEVICQLSGFDEQATRQVNEGAIDSLFVVDRVIYRYEPGRDRWIADSHLR